MKKASIIVTAIIVIAIVAGTLLIVSVVSSEIFGGISLIWLSQDPCKSFNEFTKRIELSCNYGYTVRAELDIPTKTKNYVIIELPQLPSEFIVMEEMLPVVLWKTYEFTGYNPEINPEYEECRGGVCVCMINNKTKEAPSPANKGRFCYPVAHQLNTPAFCCDFGVCRFKNIGTIPFVNNKFINATDGATATRIFDGLTFMLENKTDNLSWLNHFCSEVIYDSSPTDGVFIVDFIKVREDYNLSSGCCFIEDKLVGSCVTGNNPKASESNYLLKADSGTLALFDFIKLTKGEYPLQGRIALNITPQTGSLYGGIELREEKLKLWWRM